MQQGPQAAVINHKGRALQKPKLSLAARVANNSQKKIDTLNRIDDVSLKTVHRFFELEMCVREAGHKKTSYLLKKQISTYQRFLSDSKARQRTAKMTFMTAPPASPVKRESEDTALVPEPPPRPKYGVYLNCDPEAIGSVRRKTKTIQASSLSKSLIDLHKLRDKHISEYKQAVEELEKLKTKVGLPFIFDVSCRSYTPGSAGITPYSPIIASLRNKIKYSENELSKLQKRLHEISNRKNPRAKTAAPTPSTAEQETPGKKDKELTFKLFCDKKVNDLQLGEKELSSLTSRPITTDAPLVTVTAVATVCYIW
ncbi:uncharacterized protein [Watersipora subatra]|uniref:uncharacterized protein n=1 Tax=Watersipora subatra TaxID=2589382 RepID=UPI00355B1E22